MSQFISGILPISQQAYALRAVKMRDLLVATEANKSGTTVEQDLNLCAATLLKLGEEAAPIKRGQLEDLTEVDFEVLTQAREQLAKNMLGLRVSAMEAMPPAAPEIPAFLQKSS